MCYSLTRLQDWSVYKGAFIFTLLLCLFCTNSILVIFLHTSAFYCSLKYSLIRCLMLGKAIWYSALLFIFLDLVYWSSYWADDWPIIVIIFLWSCLLIILLSGWLTHHCYFIFLWSCLLIILWAMTAPSLLFHILWSCLLIILLSGWLTIIVISYSFDLVYWSSYWADDWPIIVISYSFDLVLLIILLSGLTDHHSYFIFLWSCFIDHPTERMTDPSFLFIFYWSGLLILDIRFCLLISVSFTYWWDWGIASSVV